MTEDTGTGCRGTRELLFNGYRVSVWDDASTLEMDSGDSYKLMLICLMPLNCSLKYGRNGTFYAIYSLLQFLKILEKRLMY